MQYQYQPFLCPLQLPAEPHHNRLGQDELRGLRRRRLPQGAGGAAAGQQRLPGQGGQAAGGGRAHHQQGRVRRRQGEEIGAGSIPESAILSQLESNSESILFAN